jgi:O-antigen ligase
MDIPLASPMTQRALKLRALSLREIVRYAAAPVAAVATFIIAAQNQHAPYDIQAGEAARFVAGVVPLVAAAIAGLAVLRPRIGLLAMLLLTPVIDVAQISWDLGPIQVIDQTIFVAAIGIGLVLRDREPRPSHSLAILPNRRISIPGVALVSMVAMLCFALVSTAVSPNLLSSTTVLLHGILEPFFIAGALLLLRPTRRDLIRVMIVLVISVAIGSLLNIAQTVPAMKTLSVMQTNRLLFSRITYFNIGLFGEMLAMTLPLLLVLLLAHRNRYLRLPTPIVAVLIAAVPIDVVALFLTFTKTAYLASFGGCLVLLLLFVHTWRRRATILVAVTLLSAVVIPWPALVLQAAPPLNQAYRNVMVAVVGQSRFDSWNPSTPSGKGSVMERWYATQAGIRMAIDHPLLGISLNQFGTQYVDNYKPAQARLDLDWAHSMLPEVAAELGIPALLLDLLIYAAALMAAWRVYRSPPDQLTRLLACGLLAIMVAWQVAGIAFAGDMYRPWRNMASDYVTMMVLMASAFALYRWSRRHAAQGETALATL